MKTTFIARAAILILITSALSGCILVPVDDGMSRGSSHGNSRDGDRHRQHDGNYERH